MAVTASCWLLLCAAGCCCVLLAVAACCWLLLRAAGSYCVLLALTALLVLQVQNLLGSICVGIEALIDLFHWQSTATSMSVLAALLVCVLVCILVPLRWVVLVLGSLVFFGNTGPFAGLRWVLSGLHRYLCRRRAPATPPAKPQADDLPTTVDQ